MGKESLYKVSQSLIQQDIEDFLKVFSTSSYKDDNIMYELFRQLMKEDNSYLHNIVDVSYLSYELERDVELENTQHMMNNAGLSFSSNIEIHTKDGTTDAFKDYYLKMPFTPHDIQYDIKNVQKTVQYFNLNFKDKIYTDYKLLEKSQEIFTVYHEKLFNDLIDEMYTQYYKVFIMVFKNIIENEIEHTNDLYNSEKINKQKYEDEIKRINNDVNNYVSFLSFLYINLLLLRFYYDYLKIDSDDVVKVPQQLKKFRKKFIHQYNKDYAYIIGNISE